MASGALPGYRDVQAAARRLDGHALRTPVRRSRALDAALGASLYFKCENLQHTGAFKFRGAFNALSHLCAEKRVGGVVAFSSGNHAQAVALSARLLGIEATIVMPADAPASKLAATRAHGARVVIYDRYRENRQEIAERVASEAGAPIIPPFDHPDVIAGQGTAAAELIEEVGEIDDLFVCLGGGGLLAGSLLAARALAPACRVYGVEPEAGNDAQLSLRRGEIVSIEVPKTIADGAQTQSLGRLTFEIIRRDVADILTAGDEDLIDAMGLFVEELGLIVEPTGCLAFAGARRHAAAVAGRRVGIIVSGGNVDAERHAALLARRTPEPVR